MRLKKSMKIIFILVILFLIGVSFYTFNRWFFSQHEIVTKKEEVVKKNGKEIVNDFVPEETEKVEEPPVAHDQSTTDKSSVEKENVLPVEKYYCSEGDTLSGQECITKLETSGYRLAKAEDPNSQRERPVLRLEYLLPEELADMQEEFHKLVKEECFSMSGVPVVEGDRAVCYVPLENEEEESSNSTGEIHCMDDYIPEGDKCIKEVRVPAKVRYECPNGYKLEGAYCVKV